MPKKRLAETINIRVRVPKRLHQKLAIKAVKEETSLQQLCADAIERIFDKDDAE